MEGPISFWGYKEQESNLILPEHDDDEYSTCFGQVYFPSSWVSQHCIHAIGICHASSVGIC